MGKATYELDIYNGSNEKYTSVKLSGKYNYGWSDCTTNELGTTIPVKFANKLYDTGYILLGSESSIWNNITVKLNTLTTYDVSELKETGWDVVLETSFIDYNVEIEPVPNKGLNADTIDEYHISDIIDYIVTCDSLVYNYIDTCANVIYNCMNINNQAQKQYTDTCTSILYNQINNVENYLLNYIDSCNVCTMNYIDMCVNKTTYYVDLCTSETLNYINEIIQNNYDVLCSSINGSIIKSVYYTDACNELMKLYVDGRITNVNNYIDSQISTNVTYINNQIQGLNTYVDSQDNSIKRNMYSLCQSNLDYINVVQDCVNVLQRYVDICINTLCSNIDNVYSYVDLCVSLVSALNPDWVNCQIDTCASVIYNYVDCQIQQFIIQGTPCSVIQRTYIGVPHFVIPANTLFFLGLNYIVGLNNLYIYYKGTLLSKDTHYVEVGSKNSGSYYVKFLFDVEESADLDIVVIKPMDFLQSVTSLNGYQGDVIISATNGLEVNNIGNEIVIYQTPNEIINYIVNETTTAIADLQIPDCSVIFTINNSLQLNDPVYVYSGTGEIPTPLVESNIYTGPIYWVVCSESSFVKLASEKNGEEITLTCEGVYYWYMQKAGIESINFTTDISNNPISIPNYSSTKMKIISSDGIGYCSTDKSKLYISVNDLVSGYTVNVDKTTTWVLDAGNVYYYKTIDFDILNTTIGATDSGVIYYGKNLDEYLLANTSGHLTLNSTGGFNGTITSIAICSSSIIKNGTRILLNNM